MICRAIPYEGKESFIFLSYCHKDSESVYPILEQMVMDGYRIWYDDGNHAGDDWLENIANHLNKCTVCLAMISEKSSASHNCKSEINEAIEWGKKLVPVLLEDFRMPLGMRLQLSEFHYIKMKEYSSTQQFLLKLYETEAFSNCKVDAGSIPMRQVEDDKNGGGDAKRVVSISDNLVAEYIASESVSSRTQQLSGDVAADERSKEPELPCGSSVARGINVKKKKITAKIGIKSNSSGSRTDFDKYKSDEVPVTDESSCDSEPETIFDDETRYDSGAMEDETPTVLGDDKQTAILIRLSSGTAFLLQSALTRIGRSERRCDIVISDNAYIGNCHAEIIQYNGEYYLRDLDSSNGTFINGSRLGLEEKVLLGNTSIFRLHTELFAFDCDAIAQYIITQKTVYILTNTTTQGFKLLTEGTLLLDRGHKWEDGTLSDEKISRSNKHALMICRSGELWIEDLGSRNGTYLNGQDIRNKGAQRVEVGTQIRLGDTILEVGIITLQGEEI